MSHNRHHSEYKFQITNIILQNNFGVSIKLCNLSKFLPKHFKNWNIFRSWQKRRNLTEKYVKMQELIEHARGLWMWQKKLPGLRFVPEEGMLLVLEGSGQVERAEDCNLQLKCWISAENWKFRFHYLSPFYNNLFLEWHNLAKDSYSTIVF